MATAGSLKIAWQFADFSTKTTTLEPLYYNTSNNVDVNSYKERVTRIKDFMSMEGNGFGDGLVSTNGAKCTGISAASFTLSNTTNVFNADTYGA